MARIADDRPAIRILTRELAELQTGILSSFNRLQGGSVDRLAILTVLLGQYFRSRTGDGRPVSVLALASSLSRPFETIRRNVKDLERYGLCTIVPDGVILAKDALARPDLKDLLEQVHDRFVRFVENLVNLEVFDPFRSKPQDYDPSAALLAVSDLMLAIADGNTTMHASFPDLVIFSAVFALNHRAITTTPTLAVAIRNETHPLPMDWLHGARPSVIARALCIAETTVRRRLTAMIGGPIVVHQGLHYVSEDWLNRESAIAVSRNSFARTRQVLANLAAAGFPFDDVPSAYISGQRPPYVDFR